MKIFKRPILLIKIMTEETLEKKCKKAVLKIADTVDDISLKLNHIIHYQKNKYYKNKYEPEDDYI